MSTTTLKKSAPERNTGAAVAVATRLGHSDATVTLQTYAHALRRRDEDAARAIQALLDSSPGLAVGIPHRAGTAWIMHIGLWRMHSMKHFLNATFIAKSLAYAPPILVSLRKSALKKA